MRSFSCSTPIRLLLSGIMVLSAGGCAVLTSSQVREVQTFAKASADYTELPGSLSQSYGILLRDAKLLAITRREFGQTNAEGAVNTTAANSAWDDIKDAYEMEQRLDAAGRRMDAALGVLKDYSQILTSIASDEYTDDLGASATKLGEKLDAATETFNGKYRKEKPLDQVGGQIGWIFRSAGGIFIRHRQYVILRDVVKASDPLVASLMGEVESMASNDMQSAFLNYQENFLGNEFKSVANNSRRLEMSTISFVHKDLVRAKAGADLAARVADAAKTYRDAHRRLVEMTRVRRDLKQAVEEIQVLKNEVDAGKKVMSAIKQ